MKKRMPPFYFISFIVLEIVVHFLLPIYHVALNPFNYFGVLVIVLGLWLNLSSKKKVIKEQTTIIPFEKPRVLVSKGIYKYSRNPMYLGMFIMLLGEALLLSSIGACIMSGIFMPLITIKFIIPEENILEEVLKNEYLNYKESVPRWI